MRRGRRASIAGGLAAALLALSLLPAPALADQQVSLTYVWQNNTAAVGFPCDTGPASAVGLCVVSPGYGLFVNDAVPGTQMYFSMTVSGGNAASFGMVFYCLTTSSSIGSKTFTRTPGEFTYAIAVPSNCSTLYAAAQNVATTGSTNVVFSGGSFTYTKFAPTGTAAPGATAGPHPTTVPTPGPTPATGGPTALDDHCNLGSFWTPAGTIGKCAWFSNAAAQRDLPEPDDSRYSSSIAAPGALCSKDYSYGPGPCYVDPAGYVVMKMSGPDYVNNQRLDLFPGYPVKGAVAAYASLGCRGPGGSGPNFDRTGCTYQIDLQVQMYGSAGYANQLGAFRRTITGTASTSKFTIASGLFTVPAGTYYISLALACDGGTFCGSDNHDGNASYLDGMWFDMYADDTGAIPSATTCNVPNPSPSCGLNPKPSVDPVTGQLICGPLSGLCAKPFVSPALVPQCVTPGVLDLVGWVSYIACLVVAMPLSVYNAAVVPALNIMIDLMYPSEIQSAAGTIIGTVQTRGVFVWLTNVGTAWQNAWDSSASSPVAFASMSFAGQTIHVEGAIDTAMGKAAPYRSVFVAILGFAVFMRFRRKVLGALSGGSGEDEA